MSAMTTIRLKTRPLISGAANDVIFVDAQPHARTSKASRPIGVDA